MFASTALTTYHKRDACLSLSFPVVNQMLCRGANWLSSRFNKNKNSSFFASLSLNCHFSLVKRFPSFLISFLSLLNNQEITHEIEL